MSEELQALQDAATEAREKADELNGVLTEDSSDEDRQAANEAEQAAVAAETAFAEAKAKADEDAGAQGGEGEPGAEERAAAAEAGDTQEGTAPDADASRTGFVTNARQGDECICPDGRKGTVHKFDEGLVCIPNADQG
jgi:hypothetical protein